MVLHLRFKYIKIRGVREKHAACEHCGGEFRYLMERELLIEALAFPGVERLLRHSYEKLLARKLEKEVEPMSCPSCGWVQADMTRELRKRFARKLHVTGWYFIGLAGALMTMLGFVTAWVWIQAHTLRGMNYNWSGMIGVCGGSVMIGFGLMGLQMLGGWIRYRKLGFMPSKELKAKRHLAEIVAAPKIKVVPFVGID